MTKPTMKFSVDKSNWNEVKLGDVATEYSERISNPSESEFDKFVGSNNISQWDFTIKSWEDTSSVTSAMKLFSEGDYLLVRRSLYASDFRERSPRATFSGVCSGDILTIRENPDYVIDGFLITILNSPELWKFVVANASGSITRRIKWNDLKNYKFLLPPKVEQIELTKLFWTLDEVMDADLKLYQAAVNQFKSIKNNLLTKGLKEQTVFSDKFNFERASSWAEFTIGELIESSYILQVQDGNHGEIHPKSSDYVDDGIPFIMANTLSKGKVLFEKTKKLPEELAEKLRIGFSKSGDVLLSHKGTVGEVAIVPEKLKWPYLMLTPQVTYYRVNNSKILSKFLFYVFSSSYFQSQLERLSSQSTRAYVGITSQKSLKILLPDTIEKQDMIIKVLDEYVQNIDAIENKLIKNKELKENLIYKVF